MASRTPLLAALFLGFCLAATVGIPVRAQAQLWYPLDTSPQGTLPTILLDPSSTPDMTILDITIHGFFYEDIQAAGQTFRRISTDGHRDGVLYREIGRPELPGIHHTLGALVGNTIGPPDILVMDAVQIPNVLVYPAQPVRRDDPPGPTMPPFEWDQAFYEQTTTLYPTMPGAARGYLGRYAGLDLVGAESYPFMYVPALQTLQVARHYRVAMSHAGGATPSLNGVTRRQDRQLQGLIDNYGVVSPFVPPELGDYAGQYLIITPSIFRDEIEPLADQKESRGYGVTIVETDDLPGIACDNIRDYIATWWSAMPEVDHYVLLVGDHGFIPSCTDPFGNLSDRMFGCVDGEVDGRDDPYPEARVGRFPCDNDPSCEDMVSKTLDYEAGAGSWTHEVLAVSHEEGVYLENILDILNADYSDRPNFHEIDGFAGGTNADVLTEIDNGRGVVDYRGVGSAMGWLEWNDADETFGFPEVDLLDNGFRTPVVFSIAGFNHATNAVGEEWMETASRAVAHYGASAGPATNDANTLNSKIFKNIYDEGLTILGEATEAAEQHVIDIGEFRDGEESAWMFSIYGDPELKIWNEPPLMIIAKPPPPVGPPMLIRVCIGGPCPDDARFDDRARAASIAGHTSVVGTPAPFAIVVVRRPGEFAIARYTDEQGFARFPDPISPGRVFITAYTEFGREGVAYDSLDIVADNPPIVTAPASVSTAEGSLLTFNVEAVDPDGDPVTLAMDSSGLPTQNDAAFDPATGVFRWTPTYADARQTPYMVTFIASNALTGTAMTQITVANVSAARAFTVGGNSTIRLGSGKPQWCVQIEPVGASFNVTDIDPATIMLISPGTGSVSQISAIIGKTITVADRDRNEILELAPCFRKEDLRLLFSNITGSIAVQVTVAGSVPGGDFSAVLTVEVVGMGGGMAAAITPNPLSAPGTLTFFITRPGRAKVQLFDIRGRLVRSLMEDPFAPAGYHDVAIDGRDERGARLAAGIYFYRVEGLEGVASGRFAVVR